MYTIGSVPYINAIPLVAMFEALGDASPVRVVYDVPSRLPALLESGQVDAIMVSSVDALRTPNRRVAEGVCIGSDGPVKSVRAFAKCPWEEVRSLAWDASSMTSNRLVEVILAERYGVRPSKQVMAPDLETMLAECDACVLIGDIGMSAGRDGVRVIDLGEEWTDLTGLPFCWAAWIGGDRLTPELVQHLQTARIWSGLGRGCAEPGPRQEEIVRQALTHGRWSEGVVWDYYRQVMVFDMDARMLEGWREFQKRLLANGFDDANHFPSVVPGAV